MGEIVEFALATCFFTLGCAEDWLGRKVIFICDVYARA